MKLVVTRSAGRQLAGILDYISQRNPSGARKVHARIKEVFRLLSDVPMAGQTTNRPGVRRMVTSPYPYIVYYRLAGGEVIVQRIRHASRKPI